MLEKHLVIYPSGELKWVELERLPRYNCVYHGEEALSNEDIRKVIDCDCLEQVHTLIPNVVMVIDESGKIRRPPKVHNELASRLYGGWHPRRIDDIVGIAVLFSLRPCNSLGELEWFPLSPAELAKVSLQMAFPIPAP